ncbi:hypothetical protein AB3G33_13865 [Flavobacterium sp. WC2421]|jgi:hypothetical protein|uniref:hypothetical protein n=1 Tax=Flavobacterium sp. WC2421 TaxID=3234138 RepID=UPI003467E3F3
MKPILKLKWLVALVLFTSIQVNAQKQPVKISLNDSLQQKEIFKTISEDKPLVRQFKSVIKNKKNATHIIGNQKMIIGNSMEMDSIDLKNGHGE